jgi:hypothetical protein
MMKWSIHFVRSSFNPPIRFDFAASFPSDHLGDFGIDKGHAWMRY